MEIALKKLQEAFDGTKDEREKASIRRAIDALKRMETATDPAERPNFKDPDFKQVANAPDGGEELANVVARGNREEGELPQTMRVPENTAKTKTPPPIEAGTAEVRDKVHTANQEDAEAASVQTTTKGPGEAK